MCRKSYEHWSCRELAAPSLNYVFKLLSAVTDFLFLRNFCDIVTELKLGHLTCTQKSGSSDSRLWWRKVWLSRENGQFMIKRPSGKVVCLFAFLIGRKLLYGVMLFSAVQCKWATIIHASPSSWAALLTPKPTLLDHHNIPCEPKAAGYTPSPPLWVVSQASEEGGVTRVYVYVRICVFPATPKWTAVTSW